MNLGHEGSANGYSHRLYAKHLKAATLIQALRSAITFRDGELYQADMLAAPCMA
ncbi:hypothetical protein GCM10009425_25720 [Pseudomonas asuensis]|uniref:Transposase n=1 Tax=Pseudomonas asuensis TaxID=1825787 RepID=A0ABQ2GU48_9PSED|nr:hypothetical protein GCM10009425_25720 [Pseudomonas asuensis]